jgi:hypothetical protein
VAELLDGPGVQLPLVGTVLLDAILPIRAVCDDQSTGYCQSGESLHQRGPDVIVGLQFLFAVELVAPSEQPWAHDKREEDKQDPGKASQCPENGSGVRVPPLRHHRPSTKRGLTAWSSQAAVAGRHETKYFISVHIRSGQRKGRYLRFDQSRRRIQILLKRSGHCLNPRVRQEVGHR